MSRTGSSSNNAVVFAWGQNEDGQLGVDTATDLPTPKVIEALLGTRLRGRDLISSPLVCGSRNTVAVDAEGQVLSWGWNARGTLGHGHRGTERKPRKVSGLKGIFIVQAAIGGWHCLGLSNQGQLYAWGGNEYGQCGVEVNKRDVVEPAPCLPHLKVVQVAAGGMHSCLLTDGGEVWVFGEPWGDFSMNVDRKPRPIGGTTDVVKIACGAFHNLTLHRDGSVRSWGINDFGQLGNGTTRYAVTPEPVEGLEDVNVVDIAAGGWHSLAITADGELYIWGRGEYGRLGLEDKTGSSRLRPTKVKALEGHVVVQASCGGTHTVALTEEGRIFTWGRASFGRLGCGSMSDSYAPEEVQLPGGRDRWQVISISAGGRHSVVLAVPNENALEAASSPESSSESSHNEQQDTSVDENAEEEVNAEEEDDLAEALEEYGA